MSPRFAPPSTARWHLRLLGAVELHDGLQSHSRLPSRAVTLLLARLALAADREHPREELVDLLWPQAPADVGRNRLRQALSVLRSVLEPPQAQPAPVLQADRHSIRLVPGALQCDVQLLRAALARGDLATAQRLHRGELLPGFFEDWVLDERRHMLALAEAWPKPAPAPATAASALASASAPVLAEPPAVLLAPRHHLPQYLTRMWGFEAAAAALSAVMQANRLVTLRGPGGAGKTRLAVEVARTLSYGRIVFVSLVSCQDMPQMLSAIAANLQLTPAAAEGTASLVAALAGQQLLLVLDNFEQLVGHAESGLAELLARLPQLHLLVTSRRVLGLDGEATVEAEPLALPNLHTSLASAAANPAVALFVDRARAVRADFHLSERNHAAIAALVRALRGLPLAIELAASRVRSFPPAEMLRLLTVTAAAPEGHSNGAHLALLSRGGPRSGHDQRHASMAQVIDWSWRLLGLEEQTTLIVLALFPQEAPADLVASVLTLDKAAVAAQLDDLVGHSMARVQAEVDAPPRFGVVEPVREFVLAQTAPAHALALRGQLRRALTVWAQALFPAQGAHAAPTRVAPELPAVYAALAGVNGPQNNGQLDAHTASEVLSLAVALRPYWDSDGLPGRIHAALDRALHSLPDSAANLRADAHELLAYLRFEAGFVDQARDHAQAAVVAAAQDAPRRARALVRRVWIEVAVGRSIDRAGPHHDRLRLQLEEALALARACHDRHAQASALHQLATLLAHVYGDPLGAELMLEQSQSLWLALGDRRKAFARLRNRAQIWIEQGRREEAMATFVECEQVARAEGDWVGQIDSLLSQGLALAALRRWEEALRAYRQCLQLCWQRWHRHGLAYAIWNLPRPLARVHQPQAAMHVLGFAATFWTRQFGPLSLADQQYVRRVRGLVRAQLGAAQAQRLWAEGVGLELADAVALALSEPRRLAPQA